MKNYNDFDVTDVVDTKGLILCSRCFPGSKTRSFAIIQQNDIKARAAEGWAEYKGQWVDVPKTMQIQIEQIEKAQHIYILRPRGDQPFLTAAEKEKEAVYAVSRTKAELTLAHLGEELICYLIDRGWTPPREEE